MKSRQLFSYFRTSALVNSPVSTISNKGLFQFANFGKTQFKSLSSSKPYASSIHTHNFTTSAFSSSRSKFSLPPLVNTKKFARSYSTKISDDVFLKSEEQQEKTLVEQLSEKYELAIRYYNNGSYAEAAEIFRDYLKPYLGNQANRKFTHEETALQGNEILDAMYHLGKIYLHLPEINNYTKSAGVFQYCAAFGNKSYFKEGESREYYYSYHINNWETKQKEFLQAAHEVEVKFIKKITSTQVEITEHTISDSIKQIDKCKKQLVDIRQHIKKELTSVEHITLKGIDTRTEKVREIYKESSEFFVKHANDVGLLQQLITDSEQILPTKPDGLEYSFIGLGSLALGTITPWSDIEFAILINEDKEEYKEYCRSLTNLIYIKLVNLGETPINRLGIKYLNDYTTAKVEDDWFADDVMMSGIGPDNAVWYGCKNPLGRQGYKAKIEIKNDESNEKELETLSQSIPTIQATAIIDKPSYELILTPFQMLQFQQEISEDKQKSWFDTDPHLVQALKSPCLITGSKNLITEYRKQIDNNSTTMPAETILQKRNLKILLEDVKKFKLKLGDKEEGKLVNVKIDIYRLTDRIIDGLANYYNIKPKNKEAFCVWQIIDKMEEQEKLSQEGTKYLKQAVSIATELRLKTYVNNNGQHETMSTYIPAIDYSNTEQAQRLVHETLYTKDTSILHHFYYVMLPLQDIIVAFCDKEHNDMSELMLNNSILHNDSAYNKGMVHARFLEYNKALKYMEDAKEEDSENLQILEDLFFLYRKTSNIDNAINTATNLLELSKVEHKSNPNNLDIALNYNNLGLIYTEKGEYNKATQLHKKALEINLVPYHPFIAANYSNLGINYEANGEYDKAIECKEKALEINLVPYHPFIAANYGNLGINYEANGEYDKAIECKEKALEINLVAYGGNINHPSIARSYNSLGVSYHSKGEHDKATQYFEKALQIYKQAYASIPNHPDIALNYNNLGASYEEKGEHDNATQYFEKALQIKLVTYGGNINHPSIARSYNNLGNSYHSKGEYNKATQYFKKALQIKLVSYGDDINHPSIAKSYNNLGNSYHSKGEYNKATQYFEKALQIMLIAFAESPNHPDIAFIYNNLGNSYDSKGEHDKAIQHFEKAFSIYDKLYKDSPDNPTIKYFRQTLKEHLKKSNISADVENNTLEQIFHVDEDGTVYIIKLSGESEEPNA